MKIERGFTLIELLMTLSIIALLMMISIASYDNLTKNARDGQRKTDLRQIQSALEQYHTDNIAYPSSLPFLASPKPYLRQIPTEAVDPTNNPYLYSPAGSSYCLFATMENASNASLASGCSIGGYNYSVSSP